MGRYQPQWRGREQRAMTPGMRRKDRRKASKIVEWWKELREGEARLFEKTSRTKRLQAR